MAGHKSYLTFYIIARLVFLKILQKSLIFPLLTHIFVDFSKLEPKLTCRKLISYKAYLFFLNHLEVSWKPDDSSLRLRCVFPTNKDILLHN